MKYQNLKEAGSVAWKTCNDSAKPGSECGDDARIETTSRGKKEAKTAREKTKKREREKDNDNEDRKMFRSAHSGLETHCVDMNSVVTKFSQMQEQRLTTMNEAVTITYVNP